MRSANFVSETTTSIAGTSGNGAVTLTQITSTPRFSTVFGTQATTVRYVIEDTVNKKFESGIGSVASNVLTRTRPQITWDGSTWDDSTPSPIAFGSTPTSGDVVVRISALAEEFQRAPAGINNSISGLANWSIYRTNNAYQQSGAGTSRTLTAAREYYQCYLLNYAGSLEGIQFEVTGSAAGNMKMALYSVASNGLPGSKIVDFTTTSTGTTGVKTDTATGSWSPAGKVWLSPGWYYIGYIPENAIAIAGVSGGGGFTPFHTPLGPANTYGNTDTCYVAGNYTTGLPSSPAPTTLAPVNGDQARHWFGLRVTP